jgi:hypothetical protein
MQKPKRPLFAADVTVKDFTHVKSQIHVSRRLIFRRPALVYSSDRAACSDGACQGSMAGAAPVFRGENGQRAITDQLQDITAVLVNGGNDRVRIIVEQGNYLLRRGGVADAGVAPQITEPEHRFDAIGHAAGDPAL